MTSANSQSMKPATVAKKLGIYLPATPQEFQESTITREEFAELQANPPEWLAELRRNGPHPRPVVAQKLNVSISGLAGHRARHARRRRGRGPAGQGRSCQEGSQAGPRLALRGSINEVFFHKSN